MSVTGSVSVEMLAPILYHEHVVLDLRREPRLHDLWLPGAETMVNELQEFARRGGHAVISLTNESMGRNVHTLREISVRSNITILAATGQYTRLTSPPIVDEGLLADRFVSEIQCGIDNSDIRAAVIGEIATGSSPISAYEMKLFRAAARAHHATDAPIATHTHNGLYARWQLHYLTSLGVPPDRIVIGHMDESVKHGKIDVACMADIAAEGAFIGIDTIGIAGYFSEFLRRYQPPDEERADAIAQLVDRGWSDNIVIAHDICKPRHLKINGGYGYGHIHDVFLPMLEERGIDRATCDKFLVDNPIRWLTGVQTVKAPAKHRPGEGD